MTVTSQVAVEICVSAIVQKGVVSPSPSPRRAERRGVTASRKGSTDPECSEAAPATQPSTLESSALAQGSAAFFSKNKILNW